MALVYGAATVVNEKGSMIHLRRFGKATAAYEWTARDVFPCLIPYQRAAAWLLYLRRLRGPLRAPARMWIAFSQPDSLYTRSVKDLE